MILKDKFINYGYHTEDFIHIRSSYSLSNVREETLSKNMDIVIEWLKNQFFSMEEIIKMTIVHPDLLMLSKNKLDNKLRFLNVLGYDENEIHKIIKSFPSILSLSENKIKKRISDLEKLNYSKKKYLNVNNTDKVELHIKKFVAGDKGSLFKIPLKAFFRMSLAIIR